MPWPKGIVPTQEERERISAAKLAASEARGSWSSVVRAIRGGDREKAHVLVDRFLDRQERQAS